MTCTVPSEVRIEVQRIPTFEEALEQKKFAKIGFKRFEKITYEVLNKSTIQAYEAN